MKKTLLGLFLTMVCGFSASAAKVHLFVLSGQSNMVGLKPEQSFTPAVTKGLAGDRVIVVKDAAGGQPIRRWYKAWKDAEGVAPAKTGDLYDRLMGKVTQAVGDQKVDTVTFVWMQGERDAKELHGSVYAASMRGLIDQLAADLGKKKINFVIGRLSDFGNGNKRYKNWDEVREAQEEVADADPMGSWVDTDAWNGPKNGLHYSKDGYVKMGQAFAEAALQLLKP